VGYVGGIQGVGTVHAGVIDDGLEAVGVGTGSDYDSGRFSVG
jgi:hypothetical protein